MSTNPERERIIDKVRKIMERAKDPAAPQGEVEASLAFAKKFMDQFNIEDADIFATEAKTQQAYENMTHESAMERKAGNFHDLDYTLAHAVNKVCGVEWYSKRRTGEWDSKKQDWPRYESIVFYGFPRDVAVATALYKELVISMTALARYKCGKGWNRDHTAYCVGFSDRVWQRAYALQKQSEAATTNSDEAKAGAIVLLKKPMLRRYAEEKLGLYFPKPLTDEERKKLEQDMKDGKVKFRKPRPKKDYSGTSAYGTGYRDGEHASLSTNGIHGRSQGQIGGE